MMTEPRGPIYMCYDAWLQEQKLDHDVPMPPCTAAKVPTPARPRPERARTSRRSDRSAERPVIIAEYVGREPEGFHALVELAETAGIPVYDVNSRLNFPSSSPAQHEQRQGRLPRRGSRRCASTRATGSGRRPSW